MPAECIDGKWLYTEFDAIPPIGRKVQLPLYKFCGGPPMACPESVLDTHPPDEHGNRYIGRFVLDWCGPKGTVDDNLLPNLGPRDVVDWRLYHGAPHPWNRGPGAQAKLPHYEQNLALLREVAPRVKAVILGNCGPELAYHHLLCAPDQRQRKWCIDRDVEFIRETGELVRSLGGRPAWQPMEREILIDCYHGEWRMARAMQEFGGLFNVCQEDGLFPRWRMIYGYPPGCRNGTASDGIWLDGEDQPHPDRPEWRDDYGVFVDDDHREPYPYQTLLAYYKEFEIGNCIGYSEHFLAGHDEVLTRHGCKFLVY